MVYLYVYFRLIVLLTGSVRIKYKRKYIHFIIVKRYFRAPLKTWACEKVVLYAQVSKRIKKNLKFFQFYSVVIICIIIFDISKKRWAKVKKNFLQQVKYVWKTLHLDHAVLNLLINRVKKIPNKK